MDEKSKKSLSEMHKQHHEDNWQRLNWRAWGSWFSWGSPVGLGILYALVAVSTGVFIWLVHHR
jgi:hypothetical protein